MYLLAIKRLVDFDLGDFRFGWENEREKIGKEQKYVSLDGTQWTDWAVTGLNELLGE
jgi:hypothetical protein